MLLLAPYGRSGARSKGYGCDWLAGRAYMYINQLMQVPIKNVSEKQASKAQCCEASAAMTTTSTRAAKKQ